MCESDRRARRRADRRAAKKLTKLRAEARDDLGVAARCVLAALNREEFESVAEEARAYVGAITIVEIARELRIIRTALTTPPKT